MLSFEYTHVYFEDLSDAKVKAFCTTITSILYYPRSILKVLIVDAAPLPTLLLRYLKPRLPVLHRLQR